MQKPLSPRAEYAAKRLKAKIAKVKIAQKQLGMEDADYRALIKRISDGRWTSIADCEEKTIDNVIREMERLGFKPKPGASARTAPRKPDLSPEGKKVFMVWQQLHAIGAVRDPSERAMFAYVKRVTGIDAPQWTSSAQIERVIETLKQWAVRMFPTAIRGAWLQAQARGKIGTLTDAALEAHIIRHSSLTNRHKGSYECLLSAWNALSALAKDAA